MKDPGPIIFFAGALLIAGLLASLLAGRLRVPVLLLFLGLGMLFGSDATGLIHFNDYQLARNIGIIALTLILFEGGLSAGFREIRPVLGGAISLALIGTVVTALVAGFVAAALFNLSVLEGLLVGSILAATDGAAVFAVLRGSTLRRKLARTLEGEAGFNDAVGVVMVLGFIEWIKHSQAHTHYGVFDFVWLFVKELGIGLVFGYVIGQVAVFALNRVRLVSAGLYPVASIAIAAVTYGSVDSLGGSGFLAVYVTGLMLGSAKFPGKRTIVTFHEGLGWLAQVTMFLALGLLVSPRDLPRIALEGTGVALIAAFVARPIGVLFSTWFSRYSWQERIVLGWAGLRGAVPVVMATFPVLADVPHSLEFFNVVFFAVLVSTLLQGATFQPFARLLGVTTNESALPRPLTEETTVARLGAEVIEFNVKRGDAIVGARVRELGLPREALLNLIVRKQQAIPPRGSTRIDVGDGLHILVRQEAATEFREILSRWRSGPIGAQVRAARAPRAFRAPFVSRPWRETDDPPGRPSKIGEIEVVQQLRTRRDGTPGALVSMADGRYAFTGPVVAIGSARHVQDSARQRLRLADTDAEQAWWRDVIGALSAPED